MWKCEKKEHEEYSLWKCEKRNMKNILYGNAMEVMIWRSSRSIRGVDMILYYCDQISSLRIHCNEFVFINAHFYSSYFNEFHFYIISYHILSCSAASFSKVLCISVPIKYLLLWPYRTLHSTFLSYLLLFYAFIDMSIYIIITLFFSHFPSLCVLLCNLPQSLSSFTSISQI